MNDFKKLALVGAIIAGLAVIGFLTNSQQHAARAQGGPTVTIDKTQLPLPVQGSLAVSGTIAATQSGGWTVGIAGTPNINVTNSTTAPALTLDISKSASQTVELLCETFILGLSCNSVLGHSFVSSNPYVVPAGQNLVVNSFDILTGNGGGTSTISIGGGFPDRWTVPNDGLTHSFQYPSGLVYPAGFTFDSSKLASFPVVSVTLRGYLTPI